MRLQSNQVGDQAPSLRHSCATCIGVRLTQRLLFPTSAPSWVCEWNPKAFSLRSAREAGPCVSLTQGRSYPFAVSTAIRIPSLKKEKKRICRDPTVSPICFLLFKHNRSLRAGGGGGHFRSVKWFYVCIYFKGKHILLRRS